MNFDNKFSVIAFDPLFIPTEGSNDFKSSLADFIQSQCKKEKDIARLSTTLAKLANQLLNPISFTGDIDFISLQNDFHNSEYASYPKERLRLLILDVLSDDVKPKETAEIIRHIWSITFGNPKVMKNLADRIRIDQEEAITELANLLSSLEKPISKYRLNDWYEDAAANYLQNLTDHQKMRFLPRLKVACADRADSVAVKAFLSQLDDLYKPQPISFDSILSQAQPKNQVSLKKVFDSLVEGKSSEPKVWESFFTQKLGKSNFSPLKQELGLRWLSFVSESYKRDPNFAAAHSPALWFHFAGLISLPKSSAQGNLAGFDQLKAFYLSGGADSKDSLFAAMLEALSKSPKGKELLSVYRTLFNQISGHCEFKGSELNVMLRIHSDNITKYQALCDKEHFNQSVLPLTKRAAKSEDGFPGVLNLLSIYIRKSGDDAFLGYFYDLIPSIIDTIIAHNEGAESKEGVQLLSSSQNEMIMSVVSIIVSLFNKADQVPLVVLEAFSMIDEYRLSDCVFDLFFISIKKCMEDRRLSENARKDKYTTFIDILINLSMKCDADRFNRFITDLLEPFVREVKYLKIDTVPLFQAIAIRVATDAKSKQINPFTEVLKYWDEIIIDESAAYSVAQTFIVNAITHYVATATSGLDFVVNIAEMAKRLAPSIAIKLEDEKPVILDQPIIRLIYDRLSKCIHTEESIAFALASAGIGLSSNKIHTQAIIENEYMEQYILIPLLKLTIKNGMIDNGITVPKSPGAMIEYILSETFPPHHCKHLIQSVIKYSGECAEAIFYYYSRVANNLFNKFESLANNTERTPEKGNAQLEILRNLSQIQVAIWENQNCSIKLKQEVLAICTKAFILNGESIARHPNSLSSDHLITFASQSTVIFEACRTSLMDNVWNMLLKVSADNNETATDNPSYMPLVNACYHTCDMLLKSAEKYPHLTTSYLVHLIDMFPWFSRNCDFPMVLKKEAVKRLVKISVNSLPLLRADERTLKDLFVITEDANCEGVNPIKCIRSTTDGGKQLTNAQDGSLQKSMPGKSLFEEKQNTLKNSLKILTEELIRFGEVKELCLALEFIAIFWRAAIPNPSNTRMFTEFYSLIIEASVNYDGSELDKAQFYTRMLYAITIKIEKFKYSRVEGQTILKSTETIANFILMQLTGSEDPQVHSEIRNVLSLIVRIVFKHIDKYSDPVFKETLYANFAGFSKDCDKFKILLPPKFAELERVTGKNEQQWREKLETLELSFEDEPHSSIEAVLKMLAQIN